MAGLFQSHDPKRLSVEWIMGAMSLTAPSKNIDKIICNDDCENCVLAQKGCAKNCVRWDDLICQNCPCLASRYADSWGETKTVDPKTNKPAPANETLMKMRIVRKGLQDGEPIPIEFFDTTGDLDSSGTIHRFVRDSLRIGGDNASGEH